jgi:cation diffusion facilitator CzcD-associated flavoprotein CzcO
MLITTPKHNDGSDVLRTPRVAIIGAGMSGIGMAAKLKMAGIESFDLYEQWDDLGGTWHANTYPGLHCDVASRYYQYTFAPNPDWTERNASGREIWSYLNRVADHFGVREHTSFRTRVTEAEWADGVWRLRCDDGREQEYDFVVTAAGGLVQTKKPDLEGLQTFAGAVFHSAEWDHSVPLEGKRIGVIGTGSTGMQITRALAPVAGQFKLFQRTPQWIFPLPNHRYTGFAKWLYRRFPALNRLAYRGWQRVFEATFGRAVIQPGMQRKAIGAACRLHLRTVRDPELRRRFTPDYQPMCKRLVLGTGFYGLFERPHVELVDEGIHLVEPRGIVTADGELHELDVIVLATGFDAHAFVRPMELIGPGGVRLSDVWDAEPYGYRSVALPGFPNVLMLIGPHSPFGNQSLFTVSETQQDFAMQVIELWRSGRVDAMAPTRRATDEFNDSIRTNMAPTVWVTGCESWFIGKDGIPSVWPFPAEHHREILRAPELADWDIQPGPTARAREPIKVGS